MGFNVLLTAVRRRLQSGHCNPSSPGTGHRYAATMFTVPNERFEELALGNDHFEFFVFPHAEVALAFTGDSVAVTRAPSLSRAPIRWPLLGLGGSRGDGLLRSPVNGLHDTTAPGFCGGTDWQQGDAPQSAG